MQSNSALAPAAEHAVTLTKLQNKERLKKSLSLLWPSKLAEVLNLLFRGNLVLTSHSRFNGVPYAVDA